MAPENATPEPADADFAKAFQEIARGEQAASAMENQLTALEQKIDALLASAESSGATDGHCGPDRQQTDGKNDTTESK
ncbi:MAG: hypothetical protein Q9172_003787 [Xanthocarpia lactea]